MILVYCGIALVIYSGTDYFNCIAGDVQVVKLDFNCFMVHILVVMIMH